MARFCQRFRVEAAVRSAVVPFTDTSGVVALNNVFRFVVARRA